MVDAFIEIAIEKLVGLGEDELNLLCGTRNEVDKLSDTLRMIHPYLHDAEVRQFNDTEVGDWLKKLKYVAYEADDVLDEWQTKFQQLSTGANLVWNFFSQCTCFRQLALRHTVGKKIQNINGKLDDISTQSKKFNFLMGTNVMGEGTNFLSVIRNDRQTDSSVEKIFGREDEIKCIKDKLMNSSETSELAVVSIVGPAGFGKTALAKHVINDREVKQYFKPQIWVCVSDQFDATSIMKKMIEAANGDSPFASENQEALRKKIADEVLKNKLFLLVLDDVWNEDFGKWEKLFNVIKNCGLRGSRILVTTRNENVCRIMGSAHMMLQLGVVSSPTHGWSIFESVAFANRRESERENLRTVGEKIVEKCKGVPLAIKTVAGALRTKMTETDWENVLKSNMWDWQPKEQIGILPALLLSYYHLSPHLKQCFRYCAIYHKDYVIRKDEIVPQWIAHGYILEENIMEMEDVAENYFDELVKRSLLQEPVLDKYNNIMECKMHDLVHDLALFVTKGEFLLMNNENNIVVDPPLHSRVSNMKSPSNKIDVEKLRTFRPSTFYKREIGFQIKKMKHLRVLRLQVNGFEIFPDDDVMAKLVHLRYLKLSFGLNFKVGKLQNLLYFDLSRSAIDALPESVETLRKLRHLDLSFNRNLKALPSTIGRLTNLRKLNLESTGLAELPDCIGKLGLLRYLNMAWTQIRGLPESVRDLSRLQVLDVSYCLKLAMLPAGVFDKMMGLKQLGVFCTFLEGLPAGVGKLTCLQSLEYFRVAGNHDGSSSSSNICELGDLNRLHGSLEICNLDMVTSGKEAARAQLHQKNSLTSLILGWIIDGNGGAMEKTSEDVLQALRPCPTLPELHISTYRGRTIPTWLGHSTTLTLSGLQQLRLERWYEFTNMSELDGCTNLSALGNLPELRRLYITDMPKVRRVGAKQGFRKLEYLQFEKMAEWEEWDILEEKLFFTFPCLSQLEISNCPKLRSLPPIFSTSLRGIGVQGCPNLSNWLSILPPNIVNLKSISAEWVNEMPSLPNLEYLEISGDDGVSELSGHLNKLHALGTLYIHDCPNLESLPQKMDSLKHLQKLEIRDCPKLKESCNKEGG